MMSATLDDIKDFEFIISEALRIGSELNPKNFKDFFNKEYNGGYGPLGMTIDIPYHVVLKDPSIKKRQIYLSYESNDRFYDIAKRFIKSHKLEMLVSLNEFEKYIKESLYIHIFIDGGEDGQKGFTKILNKSLSLAKKEMVAEDYYFPFLALGLNEENISIGSAEIIPSGKIYLDLGDDVDSEIINLSKRFCMERKFHYNHFLKIPVSKRSKESRFRIAKNVAGFIVGVLHLFGEHYKISPEFINVSTTPYPNHDSFIFTKKHGESYGYNISSKGRILWSDKFWELFKREYNSGLGFVLSQVINLAIEPCEKSIIADRLIDAIYFFNSAQQDKDESSRIVKLTTALERLTSLSSEKKDESTARNFRKRVNSLISIYYPEDNNTSRVLQEMYKVRSDISHGSWSLYRDIEPLFSGRFNEVASKAILSACIEFHRLGLTKKNDDKILKEFYSSLENPD